ncbi:HAD family hydrolase [Rhodococcus rhodnii]|uniref:Hydrolase n=2 Tax=Rhodococcus rhodnii TaxID=38312 RepID=R7WNI8_9NOCA|nr:HAD-IA family hydrolase [Rhodococcus rhodnii]EOM76867.1 hydrolase [Rhodococcus rhodnii LMG 5362]TXG89766.1 HAD family hydrolase [Rhodococcus rhodnii]
MGTAPLHAVLFDFSGTLFRLEAKPSWSRLFVDADGTPMDDAHRAEIMRRVTAPVGRSVPMEGDDAYAWENRDLDPALHRRAYQHVLAHSGIADATARDELYGLLVDPDGWTPYPDTGDVLREVHEKGMRTAVLSNIAFDPRPAFAERGWDRWVDTFVLSFQVGAVKPDLRIFEIALDRLGADPQRTLMVGDSEEADGAAAALGVTVTLVEPLPTAERPHALVDAVRPYLQNASASPD